MVTFYWASIHLINGHVDDHVLIMTYESLATRSLKYHIFDTA